MGGALFQVVIKLIASLAFRSAGAPDLAVNIDQSFFVRRNRAATAANTGEAVDQGQFVILLKEDHHAIRQRDSFRLDGMKHRKGRNRDVLPVCSLCPQLYVASDEEKSEQCDENALHWAPPCGGAPGPGGPPANSIIPTVRLSGTKIWVEIRRISAFVTLS